MKPERFTEIRQLVHDGCLNCHIINECVNEIVDKNIAIESLRKKLAITKDGYAVGLGEEVFRPQSDGSVEARTVLADVVELKAYTVGYGSPVSVSEYYASLTTAMEVAEEMKESEE